MILHRDGIIQPSWLICLVLLCHYSCCHNNMGPVLRVWHYLRSEIATTPIGVKDIEDCTTVNLETIQHDAYDPFSVAYYYINKNLFPVDVNQTKIDNPSTNNEECHIQKLSSMTDNHQRSWILFLYAAGLILLPATVFLSVATPSIYAHSSRSENFVSRLVICVLSWAALFIIMTRILVTVCMLPELALCVAMHASSCSSYVTIRSLILHDSHTTDQPIVMIDYCTMIMGLVVGGQCFCTAISGNTFISTFTPLAFFSNHLVSILLLNLVGHQIWRMMEFISYYVITKNDRDITHVQGR